ncbi:hypothetical protein EON83_20540 [bacterium]|nr:MAG: hypothetical protein EON83_20540 [bacterium]
MKNVFKKVFLAGAIALAALGTLVAQPAQAQTPTPTPTPTPDWEVAISGAPPAATSWGIPGGTPPAYYNQNPPHGLNGLVSGGATALNPGYPANGTYIYNQYLTTTFTWRGSAVSIPSTVDVDETVQTYSAVQPKKGRTASYGSAIQYVADLFDLEPGVTPTITTTNFSRDSVSVSTTTNVPVLYDAVTGTYVATLPTRHLQYGFVVDWSLEPTIPVSQYPMFYTADSWGYTVGLAP